jgi:hypothetical protein
MKTINEQIDEILERFNFKKVIGYYNLVNWRVKDKILTEEEL